MTEKRFDQPAEIKKSVDAIALAFNDSSQYPDLTITCQGRAWRCHKIILCTRSDWFQKACSGKFKEGGADTIAVQEENQDALEAMLRYCYTFKLGDEKDKISALFSVKVFSLAEKYFVKGLTELAADAFAIAARNKDRKDDDLSMAITEAYNHTSDVGRMLRDTITEIMLEDNGELMTGKHEGAFNELVENNADFAADIAKAFVKTLKRKREPSEGQRGEESYAGPGWYKCLSGGCGGRTYSAAILQAAGSEWHKLKCSKCGRSHTLHALHWNGTYGT